MFIETNVVGESGLFHSSLKATEDRLQLYPGLPSFALQGSGFKNGYFLVTKPNHH
jgi:hypothetical protein